MTPAIRSRDNQIRWRCRRGTRELDVLLERFLEAGFSSLTAADKECFNRLLDEKDPDLFNWLTGRGLPQDPELSAMLLRIRSAIAPKG